MSLLLTQLAELSPYAELDGPATASAGRSLHEPGPLVDHVAAQLGTADRVVAASIAFQAISGRVAAPAFLANDVLGRSLAVPFDALRWRIVDDQLRLGLVELAEAPPREWPEVVEQLVADTFEPWVATMRSHVRIARRLLWGNVADALVGASGGQRSTVSATERMLERLPVPNLMTTGGDGGGIRRTTCCLIYQAPGFGLCERCSLEPATVSPREGRRPSNPRSSPG